MTARLTGCAAYCSAVYKVLWGRGVTGEGLKYCTLSGALKLLPNIFFPGTFEYDRLNNLKTGRGCVGNLLLMDKEEEEETQQPTNLSRQKNFFL